MAAPLANQPITRLRLPSTRPHCGQYGVVLIISLILLVVISLLAVTSMRNAGSSESVAGNVRTTELATQAAEIALRHCENSVLKLLVEASGYTSTYQTDFKIENILPLPTPSPPAGPRWQDKSTSTGWDSASTATYVFPNSFLHNQPGVPTTYQRPPECMVERQAVLFEGATDMNVTSSFVITARGFGPEVAPADSARTRPQGSEVWLQSTIQIQ